MEGYRYNYSIVDSSEGQQKFVGTNNFFDALKIEESLLKNDQTRALIFSDKIKTVVSAMTELRLGLNFPSLDESQTGIGEVPRLRPMFESSQILELQTKYVRLSTVLVDLIAPREPEKKEDP